MKLEITKLFPNSSPEKDMKNIWQILGKRQRKARNKMRYVNI